MGTQWNASLPTIRECTHGRQLEQCELEVEGLAWEKEGMKLRSRRAFIQESFAVAATAALAEPSGIVFGREAEGGSGPHPLRLGGPAFLETDDPEGLALAHRKLGYRAAYCPKVSLNDADRIRALSDAFARHDVVIAEVGRWCNLLDADAEKRRKNLQVVTDGLALAEAIGARCCVNIAGSYNPTSWFGPHPDNLSQKHFDAIVENARKIIDAVKPKRARFTYEAMGWALPDSPDSYVKLIKAVHRPAFGVHLDPCNLINSPEKFYHNTALLNECFDKLGRWIVSCHAKDLTWDVEMNVHFREVAPGKGALDYTTYLQRLAQLPRTPPLMLEHLSTAEEYAGAREHLFEVGRKAGLSFG
jgi:sugar phosphate isomerase/epimerase